MHAMRVAGSAVYNNLTIKNKFSLIFINVKFNKTLSCHFRMSTKLIDKLFSTNHVIYCFLFIRENEKFLLKTLCTKNEQTYA